MATAPGDFDRDRLEAWLRRQPAEISAAIAARVALRAVAVLMEASAENLPKRSDALLAGLRLSAISWLWASGSRYDENLLAAAEFARDHVASLAQNHKLTPGENSALQAANQAKDTIASTSGIDAANLATEAAVMAFAAENDSGKSSFASAAALSDDRDQVDRGLDASGLVVQPLWPEHQISGAFSGSWDSLKSALHARNEDWDDWIDWYEDRIYGRSPLEETLEIARLTLPEAIWKQGPVFANSEIRHLHDLFQKDGPESVQARMEELRGQFPEAEEPASTTPSMSKGASAPTSSTPNRTAQTVQSAFDAVSEAAEKAGSFVPPSPALPKVWLLQYNEGDRVSTWVEEAVPGSVVRWKTGKSLPKDLQAGDPVIYWRTTDAGGVVGTGHIQSRETEMEGGIRRLPTEVHEFFEDDPIPRREAIEAAGIERKNWRGAILDLPSDQAIRLNDLIRSRGRLPVLPDTAPPPEPNRGDTGQGASQSGQGTGTGHDEVDSETRFSPDDAETERDDLGRGILAIALARRLHLIWCRLNDAMWREPDKNDGPAADPPHDATGWTGVHEDEITATGQQDDVFFDRSRQSTRAGFVLHLDAPWGGGKTTFANFLARVLNPTGYRHGKTSFLTKRYGDADISTVFLSDPLPRDGTGGTGDGRDWPEDARRPWIVVPFNAWQAQHVKPPWWVFYQTIRKRCFDSVIYEGWAPVEVGSGPAGKPGWVERQLLKLRLWGPEIWWRLWNPKVKTLFLTALASGALFLALTWAGVIDVLGTDDKAKAGFAVSNGFGFLLGGLTGISFLWGVGTLFTESIRPGTDTLAERMSLGAGDPFERFRRHFYRTMERLKRPVLVIVDDLDRCSPAFIVDLVRGMQTLLRSPRVVFVVLGDRDWIERAFEVHHKDMNKVSVGPEQTFGARFVEKAIQMSFILPGLVPERQKDYVRHLLLGAKADRHKDAATDLSSGATQNLRVFFQRAVKENPAPVLDSEALKERVREKAESAMATSPAPETAKEDVARVISNPEAFDAWFKDEYTIHAASDEDVETEISHRLEPLAEHLPANPRQIKRIINAVTMYNAVAFRERGWKPDDARWLQLARWVVVMTEWPRTWRLLASYPALTDLLYAADPGSAFQEMKQDTVRRPELPETESAALEDVERIKSDIKLMALLSGEDARAGEKLDRNAIADLVALTPLHSREVLSESAAVGG
ncbi:P-loop NTPase fold protein [Roseibium aggregatum]|uniref:KAP NTPase domain-containing protein n=1 Tax=Roseibium aggregatum TaxID=187304 RepID=A0A939EBE4_9HYPH|nr:P-loop NTPase fold protein [Roseibium aggregatum]MBN9669517.1 hypothetical protein [Roseibium aggregatum]